MGRSIGYVRGSGKMTYIEYMESEGTGFSMEIVARHKESFQRALSGGVKIAFGTDAGAVEHGTQAREFETMVSYGMDRWMPFDQRPLWRPNCCAGKASWAAWREVLTPT